LQRIARNPAVAPPRSDWLAGSWGLHADRLEFAAEPDMLAPRRGNDRRHAGTLPRRILQTGFSFSRTQTAHGKKSAPF